MRSKKRSTTEQAQILLIPLQDKVPADWTPALQSKGYRVVQSRWEQCFEQVPLEWMDTVILYFGAKQREHVQECLAELKRRQESLPIVCVGPFSSDAEEAALMDAGAYDCLNTQAKLPKFLLAIDHAVESFKLHKRVNMLESRVQWEGEFEGLIGASQAMQEVFHMLRTVARSAATILILGESGTGKELVAKAIHRLSGREPQRFIDLNCGAIPPELLENELFGHEAGAYVGAGQLYMGALEQAQQGTLFLDEIHEMDPKLQVKLLRLLQEKSFQRLGGTEKLEADVRVIAATNRDLLEEVEQGRFREDLYYRINVVPIMLPPLRARKEDIPLLAKRFLDQYARENQRRFRDFSPEALEILVAYDWPGNVRELENTIERVVVLHNEIHVKPAHLPRFLQRQAPSEAKTITTKAQPDPYYKVIPLAQVEQYAIESTLAKCNGDVVLAAKKLHVGQATLYRKLKKYGLM